MPAACCAAASDRSEKSPGCKISCGKVLSPRTRKTSNPIAAHLRLAAVTVGPTSTALGAFHRRLPARIGKTKAVTATARELAILFFNAMRCGQHYCDPGADRYERAYRDRVIKQLHRRASEFGFRLEGLPGVSQEGYSLVRQKERVGFRERFELVLANQADFPIRAQCRVLKVSASGCYARSRRPPRAGRLRHAASSERIQRIHAESDANYGSPRVRAELVEQGETISRKLVAKLSGFVRQPVHEPGHVSLHVVGDPSAEQGRYGRADQQEEIGLAFMFGGPLAGALHLAMLQFDEQIDGAQNALLGGQGVLGERLLGLVPIAGENQAQDQILLQHRFLGGLPLLFQKHHLRGDQVLFHERLSRLAELGGEFTEAHGKLVGQKRIVFVDGLEQEKGAFPRGVIHPMGKLGVHGVILGNLPEAFPDAIQAHEGGRGEDQHQRDDHGEPETDDPGRMPMWGVFLTLAHSPLHSKAASDCT
jgi:hypothetical protein